VSTADILRDPARLAALAQTGLAGGEPSPLLDRLTGMAARALDAPIAFFSLLDERRQCFVSARGFPDALRESGETPVDDSICQHVVASGEPLVVGDTALGMLRDNPLVLEHGIRAYAGFPVRVGDGHVVGSFSVCDVQPRQWSAEGLALLGELAGLAETEAWRHGERGRGGRSERLLRDAEEWFRSLVEQSIMAIYCYQDGAFRYVNPRCAEIFGYTQAELTGPGGLEKMIHPDDLPRVSENIRLRLSGEIPTIRYSMRGVRSDGEVLHLEVHGSRTEIEGRPALIGVGYDVTDRVRAEREREAAMQARDRFYAMASHELRTPVSTVMLYNDLLLSGMYEPLSEQQREAVERSQGSARHLLDLINDLLDLSKLGAGRMDTRREPVRLDELLDEVIGELRPMAGEQGSELRLELAQRPLDVVGDARRIRQILLNLLSNAIKFGEGRPITVRCAAAGEGAVVEVADQGSGIEADDLPRIWDDFVQLGDGDAGTGLGLPIARRLAELLGGSLEVASAPGAGTTFRLTLPAEGA
jgi:PAS domain S-box-containing protein